MAYGARLESVLGESPRGFESPILRRLRFSPSSDLHEFVEGLNSPGRDAPWMPRGRTLRRHRGVNEAAVFFVDSPDPHDPAASTA